MNGKRFKPDSNFLLKKCATGLDGGVDRISQLPGEIIVVILSFLPLRDAARTSVLSSCWLDLWKHTPNLNFGADILNFDLHTRLEMMTMECLGSSWDAERCKYIELVNSVLESHKAPSLKEFSIGFYVNKSAQSKVIKWLEFVFLRGVERLNLHFQSRYDEYYVVLEELLRGSGLCRPESLILLKPLKSLRLDSFKVSGEDIKLFLRSCPLLEVLVISSSVLTSDVEVCGGTTDLMLKCLEFYGCLSNKSVKVSAPNLTWLRIYEETAEKLLIENVPKLVGAELGFRSRSPDVIQNFSSAVLCFSSQLKIVNLIIEWPKMFWANGFPQMPNLEKLVVDYHEGKMISLLPVTALIWASPRLQEFKLVFMKTSDGPSTEVVRIAERSPHPCLKVFQLAGFFEGADNHIELVTYILDNCVALEKIIIGCYPMVAWTVYYQHVPEVRRKARQAGNEYAKRRLQGKLPQHIQLQIL